METKRKEYELNCEQQQQQQQNYRNKEQNRTGGGAIWRCVSIEVRLA